MSTSDPGNTFAKRQIHKQSAFSDTAAFLNTHVGKQVLIEFKMNGKSLQGTLKEVSKQWIIVVDSSEKPVRVFWGDSNLVSMKFVDDSLRGDNLNREIQFSSEVCHNGNGNIV